MAGRPATYPEVTTAVTDAPTPEASPEASIDASMNEAELLDRLGRLARERRAGLAALARAEGLTAEDAVDAVQEGLYTFLRLRARAPANPDDWGAWLAVLVRNAARNRRRRHFRARPHGALPADAAADTVAADEALARAEEQQRLRACVDELCEIHKAVVTLRMLEEQPGEDVARALGLPAGHVAVLLHRAKRALRACLSARPVR